MVAVFMDKITKRTLREIDQLTADLKKCERRLKRIDKARTRVYWGVPPRVQQALDELYNGLADMKRILRGKPPRAEG